MVAVRAARLLLIAALAAGVLVADPGPAAADELSEARERAQAATQELADAEARLGRIEQDLTTVNHRAAMAAREADGLVDDVQAIAVAQYVRPPETLLPDDDDLSRLARADVLARLVSGGDADALDRYEGARSDLEAASARLAALRADQESAIAELDARRDALAAELARLEELERQRREAEERARREAAAAAAAAADDDDGGGGDGGSGGGGSTPPPSGGGLTCPVPGSTFVDTWGAPRSGGRSHQGVDMMAPHGTPIYAPASGNVSYMTVSIGGLSFYVYGDNGDTYFGTHLQGYAGGNRHVAAGELIGYVGSTGNANGTPHLHFEIHPGGGAPVNPTPAVDAAC